MKVYLVWAGARNPEFKTSTAGAGFGAGVATAGASVGSCKPKVSLSRNLPTNELIVNGILVVWILGYPYKRDC